ncbi:MAG: NAD(P)H-dependent glycerol-3-phosphate dehydrogenase [Bacillota bacterium]
MKRVAVLGAGGWGTALAILSVHQGYDTTLWVRRADFCHQLQAERENHPYLPGVVLPEEIRLTSCLREAAYGREAVIVTVPSHAVRKLARDLAAHLSGDTLVISATKGLEVGSCRRMTEIWSEEIGGQERLVAISGPNFAAEVARGLPTATVAASTSLAAAEAAQDLLMTSSLRVYTNPDLIGVELGGALKNIYAIAAGMVDGMELGLNGRAALITRGLAELARLGEALGASPLTFSGLSGLGDLILTCTGHLSRNHQLGEAIGRGLSPAEAWQGRAMVTEGVTTCRSAHDLARRLGVELPIVDQVYAILFEGQSPRQMVENLMGRRPRHEREPVKM